jgi:hypothetical protein
METGYRFNTSNYIIELQTRDKDFELLKEEFTLLL